MAEILRTTRHPDALSLPARRPDSSIDIDTESVTIQWRGSTMPPITFELAKPGNRSQREALRRAGYEYRADYKGWDQARTGTTS